MRASLSTYTALLADSLCGGSSRRLIAGWWYVGDLDFDPIRSNFVWLIYNVLCVSICVVCVCVWSVRYIMLYCQTHIIDFVKGMRLAPVFFFCLLGQISYLNTFALNNKDSYLIWFLTHTLPFFSPIAVPRLYHTIYILYMIINW